MSALRKTIHVACRELGLDGEMRRDLQLLVTGKESMSDMTEGELHAVLEALKNRGFKPSGGGRATRKPATRGDTRFCHVLWGKLAKARKVDLPGAAGLNAFVRERFGAAWGAAPIDIDSIHDWQKIATVLEALKAMCARAKIDIGKGPR